MNYLAHLYLAGDDEDLIIGNFIADHVKGNDVDTFSYRVKRGIVMHRQIDTFTDQHPIVKKSINRLQPTYHKYAGVIVDMFYDHYLARNFNQYSSVSLIRFTRDRYKLLLSHQDILPDRSKMILHLMEKEDWLAGYAHIEGIHKALTGMSRRTTFDSHMDEAVNDLKTGYPLFEQEFLEFFPQVVAFARGMTGRV